MTTPFALSALFAYLAIAAGVWWTVLADELAWFRTLGAVDSDDFALAVAGAFCIGVLWPLFGLLFAFDAAFSTVTRRRS